MLKTSTKILIALVAVVLFIALVPVFGYLAWSLGSHDSPRARISFNSHVLRDSHLTLVAAYEKLGYLPPRPDGKFYYGPFTPEILRPLHYAELRPQDPNPNIQSDAAFPFDNNRNRPLYPGESKFAGVYSHAGDTDGFNVKFRGYALRYYRSASGKTGALIANSVDGDEDITGTLLAGAPDAGYLLYVLKNTVGMRYDPTNGTVSNGDLLRVIEFEN